MEMESENSIQIVRPKILRRLNIESCPKYTHQGDNTMSPMTNLAHNLSGTSLDSTPKRRNLSNGEEDVGTLPSCPVDHATMDNHVLLILIQQWTSCFLRDVGSPFQAPTSQRLHHKGCNWITSPDLVHFRFSEHVNTLDELSVGSRGYVYFLLFLFSHWGQQ